MSDRKKNYDDEGRGGPGGRVDYKNNKNNNNENDDDVTNYRLSW